MYRLWTKARRAEAEKWESKNDRGYWATGKGRGAHDAVWKQAVKMEVKGAGKGYVATLLWDAESFFERISHQKMAARARRTGFPTQITRVAGNMYRSPRLVSLNGFVGRELLPRKGVVAGCGMAMTLIKVYCFEPFDEFVSKVKRSKRATVSFDAYVDDFSITVEGETEEDVVETMVEAEQLLLHIVGADLEAKVAIGKAGLVATTDALARKLRSRIGALAGAKADTIANLGIDYNGGRKRNAKGGAPNRKKRLRGAFARRTRLASLRKALSRRQLKGIFTAGVAASADYGAAVNGFTESEIVTLRRTAAAAVCPRGRGRSLTMAMLLNGMPTAASEIAPALQYAKNIWRATVSQARDQDLKLPDVSRLWQEMEAQGYQRKLLKHRDSCKKPSADKSSRGWSACRGPLGAMILTLDRIGWIAVDAFTWQNDWGEVIPLTTFSPALLKTMMCEAVQRQAQRCIASTWKANGHSFEGDRVCTDVVCSVLEGKGLTPLEKGTLASVVADAVWTRDRAFHCGYNVQNCCPLCGVQGDTTHHRVWECPKTEEVRKKLPRWLVHEANQASKADRFWTTGVFPHPGDRCARPGSTLDSCCEEFHCGNATEIEDISNWKLHGHVYVDGSCTRHGIRELQRASFAAVVFDGEEGVKKVVRALVPAPLPQSPQAAEFAALATAIQLLDGEATIYSDCKNVVDQFGVGLPAAIQAKRPYAGVMRDLCRWPMQMRSVNGVVKVKAHQEIDKLTDPGLKRLARGNDAADKHAKMALNLHPPQEQQVEQEIEFRMKRAKLICEATAKAMAMFPPVGERMQKIRAGSIRPGRRGGGDNGVAARDCRNTVTDETHAWEHRAGKWRCANCPRIFNGQHLIAEVERQRCGGARTEMAAETLAMKGHTIIGIMAEVPYVMCGVCGAFAVRRVFGKLRNVCDTPTRKGLQNIARLRRGLPPWAATGRTESLGKKATIVGRWCMEKGWCALRGSRNSQEEDVEENQGQGSDNEGGSVGNAMIAPWQAAVLNVIAEANSDQGPVVLRYPTRARTALDVVARRVRARIAADRVGGGIVCQLTRATPRSEGGRSEEGTGHVLWEGHGNYQSGNAGCPELGNGDLREVGIDVEGPAVAGTADELAEDLARSIDRGLPGSSTPANNRSRSRAETAPLLDGSMEMGTASSVLPLDGGEGRRVRRRVASEQPRAALCLRALAAAGLDDSMQLGAPSSELPPGGEERRRVRRRVTSKQPSDALWVRTPATLSDGVVFA